MQLTIFTDYGLRSLMYLAAHQDRLCTVREIADSYGISRNHLVKVIHRLVQEDYVTSSKGKGGGLTLAVNPADLKLGDVVKKLEPNMFLVECFNIQGNTCKVTSSCEMKHYLRDAAMAFIASLNNHTIADAVKNSALFLTTIKNAESLHNTNAILLKPKENPC